MTDIYIPTIKGISIVSLDNIVRIQSISNYSKIYFADKTHPLTVAKVLQWFEEILPQDIFVRTHQTHLVNQQHISGIRIDIQTIQLSNGEKISISKRRKQIVKQRLCA
jgi:two-component system, LytTR family, response regulator